MVGFIVPILFVLMVRYCANLKAIRYESTSLNIIVADKSHRVIVALETELDRRLRLDIQPGKNKNYRLIGEQKEVSHEIHYTLQGVPKKYAPLLFDKQSNSSLLFYYLNLFRF